MRSTNRRWKYSGRSAAALQYPSGTISEKIVTLDTRLFNRYNLSSLVNKKKSKLKKFGKKRNRKPEKTMQRHV